MSGRDCANADDRSVTDNDIYTLYSEYKINTQPTVDHCDVSLRAAVANRRIRYYVDKLTIFDCGIEILLFDNPDFLTIPSRTLRCQDDKLIPIVGTSTHGVLKVSLRKQTPSATAFEFQIKVTTDFGPDMQFEADSSQFYEQPLDTGAIVGIAIAGCILIIALIGLAIYCCLKNRMENEKYGDQASGVTSNPSVFTSGTSAAMYPANNHRKGGSGGKYGSMEDVRTNNSSEKAKNAYQNSAYHVDEDETQLNRQSSYRRQKGGHYNDAFDDEMDKGGSHMSRRDSGRSARNKGKNYTRKEELEMSKVNKMPVNGILKQTRSKSPNRSYSSTEGSSSADANALVYGYSKSAHAHPNTQHIPVIERSRSRSRGRPSSNRSGSTGRSGRPSSVGRAGGKDKAPPKTGRNYADMSNFLNEPKKPRSRSSGSMSRKRADSRTSELVPSEVSFSSSKKTGGKRVHIQGEETDI